MDLECERVAGRPNRYRVFAREGDQRWEVLPAGAPLEAEARGWTRDQAISAALLAGFSKRQVERAIRKASAEADPLFSGANTTVTHVNAQLERLDGITANAQVVTGNVSALTSLFTATLGGPLVRVAALSYGVSKAMRRRKRKDKAAGRRPRGRGRDGDTR